MKTLLYDRKLIILGSFDGSIGGNCFTGLLDVAIFKMLLKETV